MSGPPIQKFIQFGCWNNLNTKLKDGGGEKQLGCLDSVMKKLKETLETEPVDAILVSGDNYYPAKEKTTDGSKQKVFKEIKLKDGFRSLPANQNIYMILGNHDLETNTPSSNNLYIENVSSPEINNSCTILKKEMEVINKIKNEDQINIDYDIYKNLPVNNGILLMLDTSMYEKTKKVNEYFKCYLDFYQQKNIPDPPTNVDELRNKQQEYIVNTFDNYTQPSLSYVIIVGHHPIIQNRLKAVKTKEKKDKDKKKEGKEAASAEGSVVGNSVVDNSVVDNSVVGKVSSTELPTAPVVTGGGDDNEEEEKKKEKQQLSDIFEAFYSTLQIIYGKAISKNPNVQFYYLCSDLHLYQEGIISLNMNDGNKMKIQQYIVGTGGTDLDPAYDSNDTIDIKLPEPTNNISNEITYEMLKDSAECGFLHCEIKNSSEPQPQPLPVFNFIAVGKEKKKKGGSAFFTQRRKRSRSYKKWQRQCRKRTKKRNLKTKRNIYHYYRSKKTRK